MAASTDSYLPDECWEHVFRFLNDADDHNNSSLEPLSVVSKQFLSITNGLLLSITMTDPTHLSLGRLFHRFPNLTSLNLTDRYDDGVCWISSLTSSSRIKYRQNNSVDHSSSFIVSLQLKSLHLNLNPWLRDDSIKMLAFVFPNLQLLDLSYCYNITEEGIFQVLRTCSNIRHLNLARCHKVKLCRMNFEVPKLEVLNLEYTHVDNEALCVISKSCRGLLKLYLQNCLSVTEKGVKHVVENCTQLIEINLRNCNLKVHDDVLASLILSRPSLKKLTTPYYFHRFSHSEMKLLARQRCIVW